MLRVATYHGVNTCVNTGVCYAAAMSTRLVTKDAAGSPILGVVLAAPFDIVIGPTHARWRVMGKCAAGSATTSVVELMGDGIELAGVYPEDVNSGTPADPLTIAGAGDFSSKVFDKFLSQVLQGVVGKNQILLRIIPTALDLTAIYVDILDYDAH